MDKDSKVTISDKEIAQLALIDISALIDPNRSQDQEGKLKCAKEID
jgi:hypothetical protein